MKIETATLLAEGFNARMQASEEDACACSIFPEVSEDRVHVEFVNMVLDGMHHAYLMAQLTGNGDALAETVKHYVVTAVAWGITYGWSEGATDSEDARVSLDSITFPEDIPGWE